MQFWYTWWSLPQLLNNFLWSLSQLVKYFHAAFLLSFIHFEIWILYPILYKITKTWNYFYVWATAAINQGILPTLISSRLEIYRSESVKYWIRINNVTFNAGVDQAYGNWEKLKIKYLSWIVCQKLRCFYLCQYYAAETLWPSDAICRQRSGSKLAQVKWRRPALT